MDAGEAILLHFFKKKSDEKVRGVRLRKAGVLESASYPGS
jgi:hypothetical protein